MAKIYAMMKAQPNTERGAPLGLFSHLVLGTILELKEDNQPTHGLRITEQLMAKLNTLIDPGQTYLTLKRLAGRRPALVTPTLGAPGGVKTYVVTRDGEQAFAATDLYIQVAAKLARKGLSANEHKTKPKIVRMSTARDERARPRMVRSGSHRASRP